MKKYLICLSIAWLSLLSGFAADASDIKPIIDGKNAGWDITTDNSVYKLRVDNGHVYPVFWGNRAHAGVPADQGRKRANGPFRLDEVPARGYYADKMPVLEVVFSDNTRDCELVFVSSEIYSEDGRETLKIVQRDKKYPLEVTSFIRVLPEVDMIEKWIEVRNISKNRKDVIKVENLLSGSMLLPPDRYFLTHHSGQWFREYQLRKTELTSGIKTLCSRDFFSFENTPWFAVTNESDDDIANAEVWFGQVHYSGNWRIDFEANHSNHLQITGGINFWDTDMMLAPGESYSTPKFSLGYTTDGMDGVSRLSHAYVKGEILPAPGSIRPVIYNSWYATGFNVNEKQQIELAKRAKEIGVELFVIDDGWFKGRKKDNAGLGDWVVDPEKFPDGLQPLIEQINDMGMDFGLWVEPEMVNPDSDLYREHPDWVLNFPERERTEWRNQLTLNLAREDVYEYLLNSMTALLSENNIKFIKWDRNRGLTQPGWPDADKSIQREVRLRYMDNLYRLIDELRRRFPDVIFENCSSGGGRPDLGMLGHMDQTWASDNTDPVDRLFIQYGYLSAWPANTMVCWTNNADYHAAGLSLDFTFDVAMQGVLGIGQDISRWSEAQMNTAKRKISEYKELRGLVQSGTVYRLLSPFDGSRVAMQYISEDTFSCAVFCYNLGETMEGSTMQMRQSQNLKFKGLDRAALYSVSGSSQKYTGEYLMDIGVKWPVSGVYKSKILRISKCNP